MMTGGGRVSVQFGNLLGVEGSNMETWKMEWMPCMELGRWRVKETEPKAQELPKKYSKTELPVLF